MRKVTPRYFYLPGCVMSAEHRRRQMIAANQRRKSASVGKIIRWGTAVALCAMLAACSPARPVGDFSRAAPNYANDTMMPAVGKIFAGARKEPVSQFNQTDEEKEMHNRVWRFLIAAHAQDWVFDSSVELQRTRLSMPRDFKFTIERYYNWLKSAEYRSSRTRYATVGSHITLDIQTLPDTFAIICKVIEIDRYRAVAYAELRTQVPPRLAEEVAARKYENDAFIAWFVRALSYRYSSYDFALDNLLVETPHEQSLAVDDALRRLSGFVVRAERHDFCGNGAITNSGGRAVIPSRFGKWGDREIVEIK
jgi:hypothetical protein